MCRECYRYRKETIVACIGILLAIDKHNDNVEGLFPSYVSLWMNQRLGRDLPVYQYNFRIPVRFKSYLDSSLEKMNAEISNFIFYHYSEEELHDYLMDYTTCDDSQIRLFSSILIPFISLDEMPCDTSDLFDQKGDCDDLSDVTDYMLQKGFNEFALRRYDEPFTSLVDPEDFFNDVVNCMLSEQIDEILGTLTDREQEVIRLRFGIDDGEERTLEEVGSLFHVTRERIRQIEAKALKKLRHPNRSKRLIDYLE